MCFDVLIILLYDCENYLIVIGWEQVNLSLISNLHYTAQINARAFVIFSVI